MTAKIIPSVRAFGGHKANPFGIFWNFFFVGYVEEALGFQLSNQFFQLSLQMSVAGFFDSRNFELIFAKWFIKGKVTESNNFLADRIFSKILKHVIFSDTGQNCFVVF